MFFFVLWIDFYFSIGYSFKLNLPALVNNPMDS